LLEADLVFCRLHHWSVISLVLSEVSKVRNWAGIWSACSGLAIESHAEVRSSVPLCVSFWAIDNDRHARALIFGDFPRQLLARQSDNHSVCPFRRNGQRNGFILLGHIWGLIEQCSRGLL